MNLPKDLLSRGFRHGFRLKIIFDKNQAAPQNTIALFKKDQNQPKNYLGFRSQKLLQARYYLKKTTADFLYSEGYKKV
jgi:hypothetical protein